MSAMERARALMGDSSELMVDAATDVCVMEFLRFLVEQIKARSEAEVAAGKPPIEFPVTLMLDNHSSRFGGEGLPWVNASGVRGLETLAVSLVREPSEGIGIAHGSDDAEERPDGSLNLQSSDLELVRDKQDQLIGIRFRGLPLERGARLRSARIRFTVDEASETPTELVIWAQSADEAAAFSKRPHDISARPRTRRSVRWNFWWLST